MYKQSILAAAVLAAAFGVQAAEQPLENFNLTTGEHTFTAAGTIESTEDGYVPPESLTVNDVLKALEGRS